MKTRFLKNLKIEFFYLIDENTSTTCEVNQRLLNIDNVASSNKGIFFIYAKYIFKN